MTKIEISHSITLAGYFGLLILLLNWFTWYSPPQEIPRSLVLIFVVVPLLTPLRGLLYGKRRTHQWANFLALPYFAMGIDYAFNYGVDAHLGWLVILFSLMFWIGCIYYSKYTGPVRTNKARPNGKLNPSNSMGKDQGK